MQTLILQEASLPSTSHTSATHTRSSALVVSLTFILRTDDPCVPPPKIFQKRDQQVLQKMDIEPLQGALLLLGTSKTKPHQKWDGIRSTYVLFILCPATCRFMNLISIYNRKVLFVCLCVTKNDHFAQRSQIEFFSGFHG